MAPQHLTLATTTKRHLTFTTVIPETVITPNSSENIPIPPAPNLSCYSSPLEWSPQRKFIITWLSCGVTVLAGYAAGAYSPPQDELMKDWGVSEMVYNLGITAYTIGFAIAPMLLAPFSEVVGRRPVFLASGFVFTVCQIGCGFTDSFAGMFVARFFLGASGSTFSTMIGGVLSDIYTKEDRNTPMAIFSGAAFFGTGLGPLVSGSITENTSWRWIYYVQAIFSFVLVVLVAVFFQETRGSVLLRRKARSLNEYYDTLEEEGFQVTFSLLDENRRSVVYEKTRWEAKEEDDRETLGKTILLSLYRPLSATSPSAGSTEWSLLIHADLLLTEPIVFLFSLWISFSYAVLYLQFDSILLVYKEVYRFDIQQSCAIFGAICIGAILATVVGILADWAEEKYYRASLTPERRLYFAGIESTLLPIGLFWFGWTAKPSVHWIVPTLAVGCSTIGIYSIYLAVYNYLADTYHRYTSSALAAQSFCRNVVGGIFPLVTNLMFRKLSIPGASSLLGGLGVLLTLVPWVLIFLGPQIRRRSKVASQIIE